MRKKFIIAIIALLASLACVCGLGGCIGCDGYEKDEQGVCYAKTEKGEYCVADYKGYRYGYNFEEIVIPSTFKNKPVVSIGSNAFSDSDITAVTIPASIISIKENSFCGCKYLERITVSEENKNYHSSGNCLIKTDEKVLIAGCKNSVIPDDGSVTAIGDTAFYGIVSLTEIDVPDSVTSIGFLAFYRCWGLEKITIGNGLTQIENYAFEGCDALISINLPDSVTDIGERAFEECNRLVIYCETESKPDGWNGEWAGGCPAVWDCANNEVADDGFIYTFIDGIRYALKDGDAAVSMQSANIFGKVVIPQTVSYREKVYKVTSIGDKAFYNGNYYYSDSGKLTGVILPDGITSIGNYAFYRCNFLTDIDMPDGVISIGEYALYECQSIKSLTLPDSITFIGKNAFSGSGLTSVTIPDKVTSINDFTFGCCNKLEKVILPDNLTYIGQYAFTGCFRLKDIIIPDSVTFIGRDAFYSCESLTEIIIPQSVTAIEDRAFENCVNLTIYCESQSKPEGWGSGWNVSVYDPKPAKYCKVIWNYKKDD